MKAVSKIMKVGGSYALILPPEVMQELKLLKREAMVIEYNGGKMTISKLNDIMQKKQEG